MKKLIILFIIALSFTSCKKKYVYHCVSFVNNVKDTEFDTQKMTESEYNAWLANQNHVGTAFTTSCQKK